MPAAGELFRATMNMRLRGQVVENVLHFRGKTGAESPNALGVEINTDYWTYLAALCAPDVVFEGVTVLQLTPVVFDLAITPNTSIHDNGEGLGVAVNNTIAAILTLRTGVAGKTHRGRMYIPGIASSWTTTDSLTPGGVTAMNTFASQMLAKWGVGGTSLGFEWGIYSRLLGGGGPYTVAGYQPITRCDPQPTLGNQRRRRLGVGT